MTRSPSRAKSAWPRPAAAEPSTQADRRQPERSPVDASVAAYWNRHIHDLEIARHPVGSREFFDELAQYRYEKLHYLPALIDFDAYRGQRVLELGCGLGLDLARFARAGAEVVGVDLSPTAIALASRNLAQQNLSAGLGVMDGATLGFSSAAFDLVYAHGVIPYLSNAEATIREMHRVLRPGGKAILMVYNRRSWLNALRKLTRVELEHADAPVMNIHSAPEFRRLLAPFARVTLIAERFPVATRLHHGWKARLYDGLFVKAFNRLPRSLTRPLGWHLIALAVK